MRALSAIACKYAKPTDRTTRSRASLYEYSADSTFWPAARNRFTDCQSKMDWLAFRRASSYENGPTIVGMVTPGKLNLNPNSARFTCETAKYGAAETCGRRALSCCQRRPRAARVS